jgi:hypothetical protein
MDNKDEWFWCSSEDGKPMGWFELMDVVLMVAACVGAVVMVTGAVAWALM